MRARRRHVALLIETSNSYARGILHGVRNYIREHHSWEITLGEHSRGDPSVAWLRHWRGDGIIARIENAEIAEAVLATGLPAVDVSAARLAPSLPWVETHDIEIVHLAIEHLQECGFRHFAYCGVPHFNWSKWRCAEFARFTETAGYPCHTFQCTGVSRDDIHEGRDRQAMSKWVAALPKPVGIMACYDICGQRLLEACKRAEVAVPEQAAVIGVDNDELLCDLSEPALSSVIPDTHRTGYLAASLLDRMMNGEEVPPEAHLVDPIGIVRRQSTDVVAVDDPHVAAAVRMIREQACDDINVQDLLDVIPLSRRSLEHRFRNALGRTPHDEILRVKLQRARQFLAETDLPLNTIAQRCGYRHVEYLSTVFKKVVGMPPSAYRNTPTQHS